MALPAAQSALAAADQGKFWPYYDKLYENYNKLTDKLLDQLATELGLDMDKFKKDRSSKETAALINRDVREASRIGVRGTPTIFIDGKRLNQRSLEGFSAAIDSELASRK